MTNFSGSCLCWDEHNTVLGTICLHSSAGYNMPCSNTLSVHHSVSTSVCSINLTNSINSITEIKRSANWILWLHVVFMAVAWDCLMSMMIAIVNRAQNVAGTSPGAFFRNTSPWLGPGGRFNCWVWCVLSWRLSGSCTIHPRETGTRHLCSEDPTI